MHRLLTYTSGLFNSAEAPTTILVANEHTRDAHCVTASDVILVYEQYSMRVSSEIAYVNAPFPKIDDADESDPQFGMVYTVALDIYDRTFSPGDQIDTRFGAASCEQLTNKRQMEILDHAQIEIHVLNSSSRHEKFSINASSDAGQLSITQVENGLFALLIIL